MTTRKIFWRSRSHANANATIGREAGVYLDHYRRSITQFDVRRPGIEKIDDDTIGIGGDGEGREQRDTARATGEAAVAFEITAVGFLAFHLDVVTPRGAVGFLCAEQLVIDDALKLFGELRLASESQ